MSLPNLWTKWPFDENAQCSLPEHRLPPLRALPKGLVCAEGGVRTRRDGIDVGSLFIESTLLPV